MSVSARDIAVWALRDKAGNVTASLRRLLDERDVAPVDRGLARELASGVVRRRGTLEAILKSFLAQPDKKVPSPVREILLVGLYQILFLDRVPAFAAVNEAVRQASTGERKGRGGFVNGVLRSIIRSISPAETGRGPIAPDVIPVAAGAHRRVDRAVFADGKDEPATYLAQAYSLPPALAERWLDQTDGKLAAAIRWAAQSNTSPPLIARVNRLRATVAETISALGAEGVEATGHRNGQSIVFAQHLDVTSLGAFRDGWIQPQDPTATGVVTGADVRAGMKVLDFCASPGTKTTHLAERMDNTGEIVAMDVSQEKLQPILDNCRRMGIDIVTTVPAKQLGGLSAMDFDLVLVDAPCSNTGVLARRPEARWRFSDRAMSKLVDDQKSLLSAASHFVRPGGRLVYNTCSIEREEDHGMVGFAQSRLGLSLEAEKLTRPGGADDPTRWHDGGYYAIFRRP